MSLESRKIADAAAAAGLLHGRMISQSKSWYRREHPDHVVVYNAAIVDDDGGHLWSGDLDVTVDEAKLHQLAAHLGVTIHVLYEHHAWPIERDAQDRLDLRQAVVRVTPAGATVVGGRAGPRLARNAAGQLVIGPRAEAT